MSNWCELVGGEDIEDLIGILDPTPSERYLSRQQVVPKVRKKKRLPPATGLDIDQNTDQNKNGTLAASIIPGTQTIFIKTWGCSHNNSDGEYMAGQLASYGYHITDDPSAAHLWLLNSCTVKNPAEQHFKNYIENAQQSGKAVVLAGCVPQAAPRDKYTYSFSVVGVQQIDRVVEVVEETLKGHTVRMLGSKKLSGKKLGGASLDLPKIRKNPFIEILAINTGCLNQCTYCKTKHARGVLGSYPIGDLVERARQSFAEGCRELWLTSEDTGAYGIDLGVTLPQLLWRLVEVIPEGCMMRIGMTNPPYILNHLHEIAEVLREPRVYAFLHVPVQSGSDYVLADMKREYCVGDFQRVVDFLRERVPGITIATDIICGFPSETEQDFRDTVSLVERYQFPSLFINQFFPRPGTPAARMRRLADTHEVKQRTKELSRVFQSYKPYEHKLGEEFDILVTETSHDNQHYVGHNKYYEQVLVERVESYLGQVLRVRVTETGKHYMKAEVLAHSPYTGSTLPALPAPADTATKILKNGKYVHAKLAKECQYHDYSSKRRMVVSLFLTSVCIAIVAKVLILWNDSNKELPQLV